MLVIFHDNCPDGMAAAAIAYLHWGDNATFHAARYGAPPPDVTGLDVVIVDFSYPRTMLIGMHAVAASLVVLDHHKTAQADLEGLAFCTFDMERSGATLLWDHIAAQDDPPCPRLFAEFAEDRDLWRFKLPRSREVSVAMWSRPSHIPSYAGMAMEFDAERLAEEGAAMLRYQRKIVEEQCARVQWREALPKNPHHPRTCWAAG